MKILKTKMLAMCLLFSLAGFISVNKALAQESKVKDNPKMEADDSKMAWGDYKSDLHAKYRKVMDQADHIQKEATERKINDPNFKKAVNRFQERAKDFAERLKNSENVPAERQDKFRSEMRSELKKLNKEYDRLNHRWEALRSK